MTRQERSAGFVLFHRPSDASGRSYLLLDYGKHWDYPKGHVHDGEADLDAAKREVAEETGISDVSIVDHFAEEITYFFKARDRSLIRKTVVFFLGQVMTTDVRLSDEHVGFAFLDYHQARSKLTFATARALLDKAERFLANTSDK